MDATQLAAQLPRQPSEPPSFIDVQAPHGALARDYLAHLLNGERHIAAQLIVAAVAEGVPLRAVYLDVFQTTQREIGHLWQLNRITVAQEHFCTAATLTIMNQFYRDILAEPRNGRRVACTCVEGDLHEIGLRIVADFFELDGWDCDYFGANTPAGDLIRTLAQRPPDLIAIAATMTYHVDAVRDLIEHLRAEPALARVPLLVGGRPFLIARNLWQQISADGSAQDAVALGNRLVA
ncbi:MAG: cobalamin-dependent protein [Gammaproteobacteria bacterium]